jgi:ferredoxin
MIRIDRKLCAGCGGCVDLCPRTAIGIFEDFALINTGLCLECRTCVKVCPMNAPQEV